MNLYILGIGIFSLVAIIAGLYLCFSLRLSRKQSDQTREWIGTNYHAVISFVLLLFSFIIIVALVFIPVYR